MNEKYKIKLNPDVSDAEKANRKAHFEASEFAAKFYMNESLETVNNLLKAIDVYLDAIKNNNYSNVEEKENLAEKARENLQAAKNFIKNNDFDSQLDNIDTKMRELGLVADPVKLIEQFNGIIQEIKSEEVIQLLNDLYSQVVAVSEREEAVTESIVGDTPKAVEVDFDNLSNIQNVNQLQNSVVVNFDIKQCKTLEDCNCDYIVMIAILKIIKNQDQNFLNSLKSMVSDFLQNTKKKTINYQQNLGLYQDQTLSVLISKINLVLSRITDLSSQLFKSKKNVHQASDSDELNEINHYRYKAKEYQLVVKKLEEYLSENQSQ